MLRRRRTEHDPWAPRYPDDRLARLSFDRLCGFPALVSAAELRDKLLQDEGLRRLVLRWLFLRDAGITRQRICELLGELTHAQAAAFFEMLVSDPAEAIRLFSRPPYPHRGPLGHALGSGRLPTRLLPLHEPDEGRGRLYLPSFGVYVPYLAPHAYVKERRGDAPADAYSMTPAKAPSAVPLRDYLPGLVVALISGEEFDYAPRPDVLEDEDLGYSEAAAEVAKPTVRFTDLRLARDVKPFQIATKLGAYLRGLGDGRPDVWRVRSWKRELLGDEKTLVSLERDFGEREAGVIAISFAAASVLMLRDLSAIFGSAVDLEGADLPRRVSDLATDLAQTLGEFDALSKKASQRIKTRAGIEETPEEDGRKTAYGEKLLTLWAYRLGYPKAEIARFVGVKPYYEGGGKNTRLNDFLWRRLQGGMEAERKLYPEFEGLFGNYEQDHELQVVAVEAYRLWLSARLEIQPRFDLRLCSIRGADPDAKRRIEKRIGDILGERGVPLGKARKLATNIPCRVEDKAFGEEEVRALERSLKGAGARVSVEPVILPPTTNIVGLSYGGVTHKGAWTGVEQFRTELGRFARRAFGREKIDDTIHLIASDLERDHIKYSRLAYERSTETVNLKEDAVEDHKNFWNWMAGEIGFEMSRSEAARRSARAYVQLGSCLAREIPVYPEPPNNARR